MKILAIISGVFVLCVMVLAVHIYVVTRPSRAGGHSRGMARIDLHQRIDGSDAERIKRWLSVQRGVDHVLVNPGGGIAVFTYSPGLADPGAIVRMFRDSLPYSRAVRYLPAAAEVKRGCPMTGTPVTNGIYEFIKRLF